MAPRSLVIALAVAGCAGTAVRSSSPAAALPFIDDDYPRARAEALRRGQLLFVEGWAPW